MFCKACGHQIDDDSVFCQKCGVKQTAASPIKPTEVKKVIEPIIEKPQEVKAIQPIIEKSQEVKPTQPSFTHYITEEKNDYTPVYVGIAILIISIIFSLFGGIIFQGASPDSLSKIALTTEALLRIGVVIWIANIAAYKNRNAVGWCIGAFFFPSIFLIILGSLSKLNSKQSQIISSTNTINSIKTEVKSEFEEWRIKNPNKSINEFYKKKEQSI